MKVRLREIRDDDLETLFQNQADPESGAMAGVDSRSRDDYLAHRARIAQNPENIMLAIELQDPEVAGVVAGDIVSWPSEGVREIGYRIGREFWGRGVATAALTALLDRLDERPLYAHVVKTNLGSIRVLEKCGFERLPDGEGPDPDPETYQYVLR